MKDQKETIGAPRFLALNLGVAPKPQLEHLWVWMLKVCLPHLLQMTWVFLLDPLPIAAVPLLIFWSTTLCPVEKSFLYRRQ